MLTSIPLALVLSVFAVRRGAEPVLALLALGLSGLEALLVVIQLVLAI